MNVYVAHSSSFDFEGGLYRPLEESDLSDEVGLVFPHRGEGLFDSKGFFREDCDLIVAEVSKSSTGLGIELGWADLIGVPILCVYKNGCNPSSSLTAVADEFIEYGSKEELIKKLESKLLDYD